MKRRLIWCLGLGLVTAVSAFAWFGVEPWTILLTLVLLVCPAILLWGAVRLGRGPRNSLRDNVSPANDPTVGKTGHRNLITGSDRSEHGH